MGMATGFIWQVTWALGVQSILSDGIPGKIGHGQTFVELILSLVVAAVLIPGWRFYVLPSALEADAPPPSEHSGNASRSTSFFTSQETSSSPSRAAPHEESREKA